MPTGNCVEIANICAGYGDNTVLHGLSLSVGQGQKWAVIGRNGCGKSTLIKLIAGLLRQQSGNILVYGKDINDYTSRSRAGILAYVPQKPEGVIPYSARDFVMLGRYASMGVWGIPSGSDSSVVEEALLLCDVKHLAERLMGTLSGGELQRVLLAGAVAQETPLLLLDEPTTFLDPAHERHFFNALERLHGRRELSMVMVTHDINTALLQCTHVCAIDGGRVVFADTSEVFASRCPELLKEIFGVSFERYICSSRNAQAFGAWGAA